MSENSRIRRRNKCGYFGLGTPSVWVPRGECGDYKDPIQSNKLVDIKNDIARKCKVGFKKLANGLHINGRALCKKYADNHQKLGNR